uniref:Hemolysin n=1 Tax=Acanthamoeba polyphaga TaxID=5757 RepID=Q17063_ACAPO|nr:hemolysin [Acanthamoeba polyphaga]
MLFTWNLSPLRPSKLCDSFEYLLLPPRSALGSVRPALTGGRLRYGPHALLLVRRSCLNTFALTVGYRWSRLSNPFSGPVHSADKSLHTPLADFDVHDHRPTCLNKPTPLFTVSP